MLRKFTELLAGDRAGAGGDAQQALRDISLEYREAELVAATERFNASRRLGSGNYGAVYRGTLPDGHDVAVKVLDFDEGDGGTSGFADEVRVLSKFRHPNLVTLMGWGTGRTDAGKCRRFLVYELLSGGDVAQRLQGCRNEGGGQPFGWAARLSVALDAASGLSHMHNGTPKAFHRDIKSANILLDRSGTAKMADFGLSGIAQKKGKLNMTCEQISGTPGYACPHYIKSGRVTEQTEVYAFGMVVLELLLNSMPACSGHGGSIIYPIFQVVLPAAPGALNRALAAVDSRAGWPPALAKDLAELALKCSDMKEERRPSFTDVGRRLRLLSEHFCRGWHAGAAPPAADPTTRPQLSIAAGPVAGPSGPPTDPTLAPGGGYPGAGGLIGRPQLCLMAAAYAPAGGGGELSTQPQLGFGASLGAASQPQAGAPGDDRGEAPTQPQLGLRPLTRPRLAPGGAGADPGTRPQLHLGGADGPGGGQPAGTDPQPHGQGTTARPCHFLDAVQQLRVEGWECAMEGFAPTGAAGFAAAGAGAGTPADLAEVVLECTCSSGANVGGMPLKHRCLVMKAGEGPWTVGRQQQPNLFARIVPDEAVRAGISRSHLVFSAWEEVGLRVKKMTPNVVLLDGRPLPPQQEVSVPNGARIGFCGRDNLTTFLSFAALLRDRAADRAAALQHGPAPAPSSTEVPAPAPAQAAHGQAANEHERWQVPRTDLQMGRSGAPEPRPDAAGGQAPAALGPPSWWLAAKAPYSLVCVMAFGYDVTRLPPEARTIGLPGEGSVSVGRVQQPGLFEGLLGEEPAQRYLCCVSRSHLEVAPLTRQAPLCAEVTNNSANPVSLAGQRKLSKGDRGTLKLNECIEFVGNSVDGCAAPVVYLRLRLEFAEHVGEPEKTERPASGASRRASASSSAPASGSGSWHTVPPCSLLPSAEDLPRDVQERSASAPFWLVLSGSALRGDVSAGSRRLQGRPEGLTVGRAHQQALHASAFDHELRQYLSREHFRVECDRETECRLVPLSSNPIWRVRDGRRVEAKVGEAALRLLPGDEVVLFTGADDCTPDGPGSLGSLKWTFNEGRGSIDDPTLRAVPRSRAHAEATLPRSPPPPAASASAPSAPRLAAPAARSPGTQTGAQPRNPKRAEAKERGCFSAFGVLRSWSEPEEGAAQLLDLSPTRPRGAAVRGAGTAASRAAEASGVAPRGGEGPAGRPGGAAEGEPPAPRGVQPLRAPVFGLDLSSEGGGASVDVSFHDVQDKFAASGFRY